MIDYVVGFLMNYTGTKVMLIKKERPSWQKGRMNGIGGKIELGETPLLAMIREFQEETGVHVKSWTEYCTLHGEEFNLHVFMAYASIETLEQCTSMTDEEVMLIPIALMQHHSPLPNLKWLIPMALSMEHDRASAFVIQEVL